MSFITLGTEHVPSPSLMHLFNARYFSLQLQTALWSLHLAQTTSFVMVEAETYPLILTTLLNPPTSAWKYWILKVVFPIHVTGK